ncbi:MAG: GNAT family N-acetyltransferase [Lachnospiraceae bacterium]|nr:GNAT family N-acetyltransferase [Lachnospiraceae bacterium]
MKAISFDPDTALSVYEQYGKLHFPEAELKPLSAIRRLWQQGVYSGLGFYHDGTQIGYAFFVTLKEQAIALLDYYAFLEAYRGLGCGSQGLQIMTHKMHNLRGIYIESEDPDGEAYRSADTLLRRQQERRLCFYARCGARDTGLRSRLFGVDYRLLYLPVQASIAPHYEDVTAIYHTMFPPRYHGLEVVLKKPT